MTHGNLKLTAPGERERLDYPHIQGTESTRIRCIHKARAIEKMDDRTAGLDDAYM